MAAAESAMADDPMAKRETLELVRAYYEIDQPELRRNVFGLIRSIASREQ